MSGFRLKFSRIAVLRKRFEQEWVDFGAFCLNILCFVSFVSVCTEICKTGLNKLFEMISLWGILVWFLNVLALFSHTILLSIDELCQPNAKLLPMFGRPLIRPARK